MELLAGIVLVIGAAFILLAGVGVVRFTDAYSRMHAAAKAPALGVLLIGVGTVLAIRTVQSAIAVLLVVVLQLITGPVGAHMLGRAVYQQVKPPLDGPDELAGVDPGHPSDP